MSADPFECPLLDALASGEPTPGGGSAAALAGAAAAALAAMVARLTAGRPRFAAVDAEMRATVEEAEDLRRRLTHLIAADAAAYDQVRAAYRLPKGSSEEQAARAAAVQEALKAASRTPLETAEACVAALELALRVAQRGNPAAATDACVAALLAHAGLQGAVLNVQVNLQDLQDAAFVAASRAAVRRHAQAGAALLQQTLQAAGQTLPAA
ncbi:MAG: cyclodeaminase/cyclohydrolase family protein [Caldilineales bacterium]|nr:cyclodeaminase/cyclohydrolase family protein [Caldilineales bacterium]MDW8318646.1 cyclodeaminase/cyclohydrolase family protein [Anaerolineae bacterium]